MTIDELQDALPWGLHDARLVELAIDYLARTLRLEYDFPMDERQMIVRRGRIVLRHVAYLAIGAPDVNYPGGTPGMTDLRVVEAHESAGLPRIEGTLVRYSVFCGNWNANIQFASSCEVTFEWLGEERTREGSPTQVYFPGEEIPDPPCPPGKVGRTT